MGLLHFNITTLTFLQIYSTTFHHEADMLEVQAKLLLLSLNLLPILYYYITMAPSSDSLHLLQLKAQLKIWASLGFFTVIKSLCPLKL